MCSDGIGEWLTATILHKKQLLMKTLIQLVCGVVCSLALSMPAVAALFDRTVAPIGGSAGQSAASFGVYFTPQENVYLTQLGAFSFSSYSSGSAQVEVWEDPSTAASSSAIATATIPLSGTSSADSDFQYRFQWVSGGSFPTLTAYHRYLLVWKDNTGSASQPFGDGAHAVVNGAIGDYLTDPSQLNPSLGLLMLNYTYIFSGGSLAGINPWDEQHQAGWQKSVVSGSPPYLNVNIEVQPVPEPASTSSWVGALTLGFGVWLRGRRELWGGKKRSVTGDR